MRWSIVLELFLAVMGSLLIFAAKPLEPYKDAGVIYAAGVNVDSELAAEEYRQVRNAQLTWKFTLEDYGRTLLDIALVMAAAGCVYDIRANKAIQTPTRSWRVIALGLAAATLTAVSFGVCDSVTR